MYLQCRIFQLQWHKHDFQDIMLVIIAEFCLYIFHFIVDFKTLALASRQNSLANH